MLSSLTYRTCLAIITFINANVSDTVGPAEHVRRATLVVTVPGA